MNISVDTTAAEGLLAKVRDQIPFATAVALNRTGEDANAAIRATLPTRFTIRDKNMPRYVAPVRLPRENQATKDRLYAILATEGRGRILAPFEEGLPKVSNDPMHPVAVPTHDIRFQDSTVIPRKWYPQNLGLVEKKGVTGTYFALGRGAIKKHLTPYHTTKHGATQIKGKLRTFVLDPRFAKNIRPDQYGVYVRVGPARGDIRMIWQYRRRVTRPKDLHFINTTRDTVMTRWKPNWEGAMTLALSTAISRGRS